MVTKISAKIDRRKIVWISITTVIARPRCGRMMKTEALQRRGSVHLGGLELLAVERLQRGQQDQRGEGQPLPGHDQDDRGQRRLAQPIDGLGAEELCARGEEDRSPGP